MEMKKNFKKKVLKNGMVILLEKRNLPVVSVAFAVRNGGINENISEKGISHFIEHMLYKGTPSRTSRDIAEQIERNGGELNGFTSEEITAYWCRMPSEKVNFALEVLSDMIKNPKFDNDEMEKERRVIFEEIKMRKDNPQIYVFDKIQNFLYSGTLSLDLIGTEKTINSINKKKITDFFNIVYRPNNLILAVVGDANFEDIVAFAEKNFGDSKGEIHEEKITLKNETKVEYRAGVDQANVVFAYHVPFGDDDKSYAARVLSAISAEGMSSRLFIEIREKRNLAYGIKGGSDINKRYGHNFIFVGTTKENVEIVRKLILEEMKKISKDMDESELESIKTQIIGHYKTSMEDSHEQLVNIISSEIQGKAEDFYDFEKKIKNVSLKEVRELAEEISKGKYSFFALVPR